MSIFPYRQIVRSHTISGRVVVRKQSRLQHAVGRGFHAGRHVGGAERGLLHFVEVVVHVAIEGEFADFAQGIVLVRPYLEGKRGRVFTRKKVRQKGRENEKTDV